MGRSGTPVKTLVLGPMPENATTETHLPAGPWCFDGQEASFPDWEKVFEFPPDSMADPEKLDRAAKAAQALASRMIPRVAALLSSDWETFPKCYWEILLAPWAMNVATMLVDRAIVSRNLLTLKDRELDVPILPENCAFSFADEQDLVMAGIKNSQFNHWLLSRLLEMNWPEKWRKTILEPVERTAPPPQKQSLPQKLREKLRLVNTRLPFPRMKGMSIPEALRYSQALSEASGEADNTSLEEMFNFEEALAEIPLPPDILDFFALCLPQSIRKLDHSPAQIPVGKSGKMRFATIRAQEEAAYRQELALWKAAGNRIGFVQHGGNYGMIRTPATARVVEYSQDCFVTWGWKKKGKFIPLPSPQLCKIASSWTGGSGKLIFVGTEMATLRHRLDSHPTPLQFIHYRRAKAEFIENLPVAIQENTLYRPYFDLPGTLEDAKWLQRKFPDLEICRGPLLPQLLKCRLLVLDHHGTTLLEAMAADIPVICYWDREAWQLTPEASIILDILQDCGIWQPGPIEAAQKVAEVWANVSQWWQGAAVRAARGIFCKNFALVADAPDSVWVDRLKKL